MSSKNQSPHGRTIAATAGHFLDIHTGAIVPPLNPSTTFGRDDRYDPLNPAHLYARDGSPAFVNAERIIAELENGRECRLFSSGMAAIASIFYSLESGSHVLLPDSLYWGVDVWTNNYCERVGIRISRYDPLNLDSIRELGERAGELDIIWVETPSNPMIQVVDIKAVSELAREFTAMLIVDSTAATPVLTKPLELGADLVVHSATKYLNGHSDMLAGAIVTAEEHSLWSAICAERFQAGAVPGAFECWLLVRGMRTLYLRVQQAASNALQIASFLQDHDRVSGVLYPGLASHPGHDIACSQMQGGFGGLLSFYVDGTREQTLAVAGGLKHIVSATSLGGVETLIEHRHSIEPPETGVPDNLLRLSVGIEQVDDLISDVAQSLDQL